MAAFSDEGGNRYAQKEGSRRTICFRHRGSVVYVWVAGGCDSAYTQESTEGGERLNADLAVQLDQWQCN